MSGGSSYDEMKVESAVLADIAHGPATGTSRVALKVASPYDAAEVDSAIERLLRHETVHEAAGKLVLGPEQRKEANR
jgi:hypothetical protein